MLNIEEINNQMKSVRQHIAVMEAIYIMRYFWVAIIAISLMGCVPYSDHPLTDPGRKNIDASILGTWFWKDDNESGYVHIGIDEKSKLLRLMMLDFDKDGELEVSEFSGHSSALENNKYLNLKWAQPADALAGYIFVKYNVSQKRLGISIMNTDVVEKAIHNGLLSGSVKKGKWSSSIQITEGQKKLQQFILRSDKALFPEIKYLPRLQLPNSTMKPDRR